VSFLDAEGAPDIVERTLIRPRTARLATVTKQERAAVIAKSPVKGKYDTAIDSESTFEQLQQPVQDANAPGGTA
jgi:DNA double-strand break repair helicase HerA and related ATPase